MNQEELEKLCEEWKQILGLSHWDTVVKIVRQRNMITEGNQAECSWQIKKCSDLLKGGGGDRYSLCRRV